MVLLLVIGSLSPGHCPHDYSATRFASFRPRPKDGVPSAVFGWRKSWQATLFSRAHALRGLPYSPSRGEGGGAPRRRWCGSLPHRVARLAVGPISGSPEIA